LPKPYQRSRSQRRLDRVTPSGRHVIHYRKKANGLPHCSICRKELSGISINGRAKGRTLKTNARLFGGVLCANCTSKVITYASRVEQGEMKLNDVDIRHRTYILQIISH
jgi:large subunit ribosomal protein L34e